MTTTPPPDPWPAIDELAGLLNDLASQVLTHTTQLQHLAPAPQATRSGTAVDHAMDLRAALVDEYGLHGPLGPPERWETIPPLRAELLGLKVADVRQLKPAAGILRARLRARRAVKSLVVVYRSESFDLCFRRVVLLRSGVCRG